MSYLKINGKLIWGDDPTEIKVIEWHDSETKEKHLDLIGGEGPGPAYQAISKKLWDKKEADFKKRIAPIVKELTAKK